MTDYAVGDIQGCLDPLQRLLDLIDFNPDNDLLLSVGDIVNRGPRSLDTLRFCKNLGDAFAMVLGNHDLHLLATYYGMRKPSRKDTLQEILDAPDAGELLQWLQKQPLLLQAQSFTLVHAGIPPFWSAEEAARHAAEVELALRSDGARDFFAAMYGDAPEKWCDSLEGPARLRTITNYLTRMRFCTPLGVLDLSSKGPPETAPPGFHPWFAVSRRKSVNDKIIFGHWASLQGRDCGRNLYPLDTGCVWGGPLRVMRLDTERFTETSEN